MSVNMETISTYLQSLSSDSEHNTFTMEKLENTVKLGTFVGILIWQIGKFFTNRPNLLRQTHELTTRIMVRNRVVCGTHIFTKLKSTNNLFRPIRQL